MAPPTKNAPAAVMAMSKMQMPAGCLDMAKKSTNKQMPCDGMGCGCCLCGTCATPPALDVALQVQLLDRPSGNTTRDDVIPKGIIAPPALPPPIA